MSRRRTQSLRVLRGGDSAVPAEGRAGAAMLTLQRVAVRSTRATAALAERHGLTLGQAEVLLCLDGGEGVTQQDLAERLLVTKGNVCVIVQRMEAGKLIERRPDPTDQRANRLFLTGEGRRQLAAVRRDLTELQTRIAGTLAPTELAELLRMLVRLEQSLDDLEVE